MNDTEACIERLFQPDLAAALIAADETARQHVLHRTILDRVAALPPLCRQLPGLAPPDVEELRIAKELRAFRMPLMDGTSIPMGLPYDWYYGVADGHQGGQAPRFIVPRVAFSATLVRAAEATGDPSYYQALHDYVVDYVSRHWVDSTELPEHDNWLCTACCCGDWQSDRFRGLYAALSTPEVVRCFTFDELLAVFRAIDLMLTGLIPNLALGSNWRVYELTNIFTQGFCWNFLRQSPFWLELAVNGLNEEFAVQFYGDGSHEEPCTHYGAGTWQTFAAYYALAREVPDVGLRFDPARMARCMEYVLSASKPFGPLAPLGDDYASRTPQALDGQSPPFPANQPPDWNGTLRRGAAWLAGQGIAAADFVVGMGPPPAWTSRFHRDSGYLFLRDGWASDSLQADLNLGHYANCHCHYGLLGLELAGYGREFVVDPGCSALDDRPINANMARTRAHSTLCVDGLDQQVVAPVTASRCFLAEQYDFAVGVYRGGYRSGNAYGPGCTSADRFDSAFSGTHFRHLLFVKESYWVLFDAIATLPGYTAETRLQFLPNAMRALPGNQGYATGWAAANLALIPLQWDGWSHQILAGDTSPIEGWMPAPGGEWLPAPVYKATCPTTGGPVWHGTLLFPYRGAELPRIAVTPLETGGAGFAYRIETDAYTDYLFLSNSWSAREIDLGSGIRTNAPLLHLRQVDGEWTRGCTCEGTWLEAAGETLFTAPGTMLAREFTAGPTPTIRTMQPRG